MFFSEQPGETITQQRGNSLLRVSLNITIFPSESFSGFRNRGPEPVTPMSVLRSFCSLFSLPMYPFIRPLSLKCGFTLSRRD